MRSGEGGWVVLNSRGGEDLAPPGRVECVHFVSRAGQGADLAGTPETPETPEGGGPPAGGPFLLVLGSLGIYKIHGNGLDPEFLDIGETGYWAGSVVVVHGVEIVRLRSVDGFVESRENLGRFEGGYVEEATPDFGGGKAAGREASNDAEVIGAAFEGTPEVAIDRCRSCSDGAGGEDHFVAENIRTY